MIRFQETYELQISGSKFFAAERWRDALIHYVSGVWDNEREVMIRPKISFDRFSLRLSESTARYWAHKLDNDPDVDPPFFSEADALIVRDSQEEVEVALLRFVWGDRIRALVIKLEDPSGMIRLWKGRNRGELFSLTSGLPTMNDLLAEYREQRSAMVS